MEGVDSSLAFRIARRRRDAINGKLSPTEGPAASRSVNNDVDTAAVCDRPCCHGRRNREVWGTMSPSLLGPAGYGGGGRSNENDLCFYSRQSLFKYCTSD